MPQNGSSQTNPDGQERDHAIAVSRMLGIDSNQVTQIPLRKFGINGQKKSVSDWLSKLHRQ